MCQKTFRSQTSGWGSEDKEIEGCSGQVGLKRGASLTFPGAHTIGGSTLVKSRQGDTRYSHGLQHLLLVTGWTFCVTWAFHPSLSVQRKMGHVTLRTTASLKCWAENGGVRRPGAFSSQMPTLLVESCMGWGGGSTQNLPPPSGPVSGDSSLHTSWGWAPTLFPFLVLSTASLMSFLDLSKKPGSQENAQLCNLHL